jgi:amino acid transporter
MAHRDLNQAFARWAYKKPVAQLQQEAAASVGFRRTLTTLDLTLLGVGVVIGTGIFVLTGRAAAANAGPAVFISFMIAAIPAALAALCYAELAALLPVAGSVYTYTYATLGEACAFLIGWDLMLEYIIGAAAVGVGWSAYFTGFVRHLFGIEMPAHLCKAPVQWNLATQSFERTGATINLPAVGILCCVTLMLLRGPKASARLNSALVVLKLGLIAAFVFSCIGDVKPENFVPLVPANTGVFGQFGISGILRAASLLVFAYLGVDNLSTTALEAKDPQHTLPRAIVMTVIICTFLYVLVAIVTVGVVPYQQLDVANPIAVAAAFTGRAWLTDVVEIAAVFGLGSVLLVQIYAMPRIVYSMARDGLLPGQLAKLSGKTGVPALATCVVGALCAALAGLLPIDVLGELCSSGTLFAFVLVSVGVCIMRLRHPDLPRKFKVPFGPYLIPGASVAVCMTLMGLSGLHTLVRLMVWLAVGLCIYLLYGVRHARR